MTHSNAIEQNLLAGRFTDASSGGAIEVRNPATGELVGSVPGMTEADLVGVFAAAEEGARSWKATNQLERGRVLFEAARLIREQAESLTSVIVAEMGKTRAEASGEVAKAAEFFEFYGGMGRDAFGELLPDARDSTLAARVSEPLGVVVLVTPWNDPLLTPARKLAPALISGNSVVLKPATATPIVALRLAAVLHEAGLPAGALGTVTGNGRELGEGLFTADCVRAVSFTGSTEVGLGIQRKLAGRNIRVQTEMGGKNAAVIMDDADLELAIPTVVAGAFAQAGQRCTATSRLLVHSSIAKTVRQRLVEATQAIVVAEGNVEGAHVGPVIDAGAATDIRSHVERAVAQGAVVHAQAPLEGSATGTDCFSAPTLLGINTRMEIWKNEVFGPVLGMTEFDTLDEAISGVNDSSFGLSSAIFTRSLDTAFAFLNGVDTGQVSVNQPTSGWDIHHPFGGFKESGSGYKEQGRDALHFYTRTKTAAIRTR